MRTRWIHANIYNPETVSFAPGELLTERGRVIAGDTPLPAGEQERVVDAQNARIVPGLIDIHTHGRAGGDFTDAEPEMLRRMAKSYLSAGVTAVIPTLASAPLPDFPRAAERIAQVAAETDKDGQPSGARLIGYHLEGRYLNPKMRGAHAPELLATPDADELIALTRHMQRPFRDRSLPCPHRISAAFELDADGSFREAAKSLGYALSLGHTAATYEEALDAVRSGVGCFTHLYNAMTPLHHRAGGPVAACFDSPDAFGELICDGFHVSPEIVRMTYRNLGNERLVLISDSMEGTACPDGAYRIAGMPVLMRNGKAYTVDGHIAGSTVGLWEAVGHLMDFCHLTLEQALPCATRNPAHVAGIADEVGALTPGHFADFLLLDDSDEAPLPAVRAVYVGGVCRHGTPL